MDRSTTDADCLLPPFSKIYPRKSSVPKRTRSVGAADVNKRRGSVGNSLPIASPIYADEYDFSHARRGAAIVFNHERFNNRLKARNGAKADAEAVRREFHRLGFDVRMFQDLRKQELLQKLEEVSEEDHTNSDCLAVIVMTHGNQNELNAFDETYKTSKLWKAFTGDKCKSLRGKPKLFFIQACRGKEVDAGERVGVPMVMSSHVDSAPQVTYVVPNMADIFVAYATFDGYYAFRNSIGSWFIQELCAELSRHGEYEEICILLTHVNRRVAFHYESNVTANSNKDKKKQIPNFFSSLTREVYFRPKQLIACVSQMDVTAPNRAMQS